MRPDCRWVAPSCSSTRSIRSTRAACSAGEWVLPNLPLLEYGRTSPAALAASGADPKDVEAAERWRRSPFYQMLQTGQSLLRRRVSAATVDEFSVLPDLLAAGMTDYVGMITRFAA